jgi:hypothetical protein
MDTDDEMMDEAGQCIVLGVYRGFVENLGSELPDEQRILVILNTLYTTIKYGDVGDFQILLGLYRRDLLENLGSELSDEQRIPVLLNILDAAIKGSSSYNFNSLFCDLMMSLLKPYGFKLLLYWAIEQFKKINKKVNVSYGSKAIQQAIKAEGEALTEAQSISFAVNKYQESLQSNDAENCHIAFKSLLDNVKHAHHLFTSLYTSLHPLDVDME